MSSDAIIQGLKQGNALEMASLEEVKEGMSSVIDGLLKECYNRSDALSDLMEKLKLDRSTASYTTTTLTSEQKALLKHSIERGIRDCDTAYQDDLSKFVDKLKDISADSLAEVKALKEAAELEHLHNTDTFLRMDLIARLPYSPHISAFVMTESHKETARKARCDAFHAAQCARISERANARTTEATAATHDLIGILLNQLRSLWAVAAIADIDLDSTTDFRVQKVKWLGELLEVRRADLEEFRASMELFQDGLAPQA